MQMIDFLLVFVAIKTGKSATTVLHVSQKTPRNNTLKKMSEGEFQDEKFEMRLHGYHNNRSESAHIVSNWSERHLESKSIIPALLPNGSNDRSARRLPFMMPVMYNLGVITTLLVILTVLMFKGLTLGVIMLILTLGKKGKVKSPLDYGSGPIHIHVHNKRWKNYGPYNYPGVWNRNYIDPEEEETATAEYPFIIPRR